MNNDNINLKHFFQCIKCKYKTHNLIDMKRHLKRKNKCDWDNDLSNNNLSDIEIYNESIIKKYDNIEDINKIYDENKKILNNQDNNLNQINDSKIKCEFCFKSFTTKYSLERHLNNCKTRNIIDFNNKKIDSDIDNIDNNNDNNNLSLVISQKENNNNDNDNNNIITEEKDKILVSFYDNFDTSHISLELQIELLFSTIYEDTLTEILKNDLNLNYFIQNNIDNKSLIYVNKKYGIQRISNNDIYELIWNKVKDYLLESLKNIKKVKSKYSSEIFDTIEKIIINKYNYIHSKDINVVNRIKEIIYLSSLNNKDKILNKFQKFYI